MNGRGGDAPLPDGADFLLQLLRRPPNSGAPFLSTPQPYSQNFLEDPAVAAVGPPISTFPSLPPTNHGDFPFPSWSHLPPPHFAPQNHFRQNSNPNPNLNPNLFLLVQKFNNPVQFDLQSKSTPSGVDTESLNFYGNNSKSYATPLSHNLIFGSLNRDVLKNGANVMDQGENNFASWSVEAKETTLVNSTFSILKQESSTNSNGRMKRPGFSSYSKNVRHMEHGSERKISYIRMMD